MAACGQMRKRARSDADDCEECMPISKRINNLHIRHGTDWEEVDVSLGGGFNNNIPGPSDCSDIPAPSVVTPQDTPSPVLLPGGPHAPHFSPSTSPNQLCVPAPGLTLPSPTGPRLPTPAHSPGNHSPGPPPILHPGPAMYHPQYTPLQSKSQNPYYFDINSTLYNAHLQRIQRVRGRDNCDT